MGCNLAVVINNYHFAKEAMLKKGTDFAGRPPHYVGSLFSRNGKGVGFQTFSETWKKQQKAIIFKIKEFARKEAKLERIVSREVDGLIYRMRGNGGSSVDPLNDVTFFFGNVVASFAFGERYKDGDHEFWQLMGALTVFVEGLAATSFIDTFPFLKLVPFSIVKKVKDAVNIRDTILNKIYSRHKMKLQNNNNCQDELCDLTDHLIKIAKANELTEDHIVMTMNDTIMAGSETPTINFLWIMYYLVKYPDVQERLQHELDDVIGGIRAPEWDERQRLPYLEAFITEVLRHCSVMPLGIPHQAMCDSTIGPYQVPKGTTVLLNIYAIHHDPDVWENPMDFNPDRFLDEHSRFSTERATSLLSRI
jgi:steroid 17alpha-monooxygenase/17alpha-hydroxyprogesterone aldolase